MAAYNNVQNMLGSAKQQRSSIYDNMDKIELSDIGSEREQEMARIKADLKTAESDVGDRETRQSLINAIGKITAGLVGLNSLEDKNSYGVNVGGIAFDKKDYDKEYDRLWKQYMSDKQDVLDTIKDKREREVQQANLGMSKLGMQMQGTQQQSGEEQNALNNQTSLATTGMQVASAQKIARDRNDLDRVFGVSKMKDTAEEKAADRAHELTKLDKTGDTARDVAGITAGARRDVAGASAAAKDNALVSKLKQQAAADVQKGIKDFNSVVLGGTVGGSTTKIKDPNVRKQAAATALQLSRVPKEEVDALLEKYDASWLSLDKTDLSNFAQEGNELIRKYSAGLITDRAPAASPTTAPAAAPATVKVMFQGKPKYIPAALATPENLKASGMTLIEE